MMDEELSVKETWCDGVQTVCISKKHRVQHC